MAVFMLATYGTPDGYWGGGSSVQGGKAGLYRAQQPAASQAHSQAASSLHPAQHAQPSAYNGQWYEQDWSHAGHTMPGYWHQ
mmetsp:Transcript_25838/g.65720  ORF Transcript_25838/g.65720 Transcript_25838/m.65720 type:complete len:82 (+) Transcript_25838:2261-2506(+)